MAAYCGYRCFAKRSPNKAKSRHFGANMQTEINQGGTSAEAITPRPSATVSGAIAATAPGQLRVIKRNGTVVPFEDSKITVAITKAFLAVEGGTAAASSRIHETVAKLTEYGNGHILAPHALRRHHPYRGYTGSGGTVPDALRRAQNSPGLCDLPGTAGAQTRRQAGPVPRHPGGRGQYHCRTGRWQPRATGPRPPAHHCQRGLRRLIGCQRNRNSGRGPEESLRRRQPG